MIMNDLEILRTTLNERMIEPFEDELVRRGVSYGLSSFGYDARLGNEFKWFDTKEILDPLAMDSFEDVRYAVVNDPYFIIPAHGFVLARTVEYFRIPQNVLALCVGKSTYARLGLVVNVTPLEPGWEGQVTLELSNTTKFPLKVYINQGICQFIFFKGNQCRISYRDRKGKYNGQVGVTLPRAH